MRRWLSPLIVSASLAAVGDAWADRVSAHLTYTIEPGIERCPTERELVDAVAARLGYDPFAVTQNKGSVDVHVTVKKSDRAVLGKLSLGNAEREITSSDCREAVDALAVAIAIGIDPTSLSRPPEPPPPEPPPPEPKPEPTPPPPPPIAEKPPAKTEPSLQGRAHASVLGFFGETPNAAPGLALGFALRYRWFEPTIEGFASFSSSTGNVSASLAGATLAPCVHIRAFFGCATTSLGNFHGDGKNLVFTKHADEFYASLGGRVGAELRIGPTFFARLSGELAFPLTKISLQVDDRDAWTSPSVAARIGLSIGLTTFE